MSLPVWLGRRESAAWPRTARPPTRSSAQAAGKRAVAWSTATPIASPPDRRCDTFDRALVNICLGGSDRLAEHYEVRVRDGAVGPESVKVIAITRKSQASQIHRSALTPAAEPVGRHHHNLVGVGFLRDAWPVTSTLKLHAPFSRVAKPYLEVRRS